MFKIYQQTISKSISFKGIGLHSGKKSKVTIYPAKPDHGIIFKRVDLEKNNTIKANFKNVISAKLCTTLGNESGVKISTVEHILAAIYICEIDNAIIEVDNEEIPIMDGSSKEFVEVLRDVELKTQNRKRKYLKIIDNFEFVEDKKTISIEPHDSSFVVDFQLDYKNKIIGKQRNVLDLQSENLSEIYSSRTFCLYEDIEKIRKIGLAKGGSLDNAIVVKKEKVLNEGGLRNEKEFVNHKILDLVGDFTLSGYRVLGKVVCYHGGHELTNKFLRKLFLSKQLFTELEMSEILISKKKVSQDQVKLVAIA